MLYIENIVFFCSLDDFKISSYPFKELPSDIFYDKNFQYFYDTNKDYLNHKIKDLVKYDNTNCSLESCKIRISKDGFINVRLEFDIAQNFHIDNFDCESSYKDIYEFIIKELNLQKNNNFDKSYLFHQHIYTINTDTFCNDIEIEWSVYKHKNEKTLEFFLDLDVYLLEEHIYYTFYSDTYLENMKTDIELKKGRDTLLKHRTTLTKHHLLLNEFKTKTVNTIKHYKLLEIHNINFTKNIYDKLDKDFENLIENKEKDRQYKSSQKLNQIILILTTFSLISVITGYISLMISLQEDSHKLQSTWNFINNFSLVFSYVVSFIFIVSVVTWFYVGITKLKELYKELVDIKRC